MPLSSPILPDTPISMDHTSDNVFKVDSISLIRLDMTPNSAFTTSVPDDHARKVFLAHTQRVETPLMPIEGPDSMGGVAITDGATLTTFLSLASEITTTSLFNCCALLDSRVSNHSSTKNLSVKS